MRPRRRLRRRSAIPLLGLLLGSTAGIATIALATAAAQQSLPAPRAVLDATHVPPLITLPGERVELAYDVHCAASGDHDVDRACEVGGSVFVRASGNGAFAEMPLVARSTEEGRQLVAAIPDTVSARIGVLEYYAVLAAPELGERLTIPAGGADAPHASRRVASSVDVPLGRHEFGSAGRAGSLAATAAWGDGPGDVGLEPGRNLGPIGASAFDVDASGTVAVLDQAHRRLLRWRKGARRPTRVPVSVNGTLADLALGGDGSAYVLETTAPPGRNPLVRRFDDGGRELEAIEIAEPTAAQILPAPSGPVVLGRPSHHWMPVVVDGTPATPAEQRRHGRASRALRGGGDIVVFRRANELRISVTPGRGVTRSWQVTSDTSLAEVQLAEAIGQRLVLVVRVYDERNDEFAVLVLDANGVVDRFAVDSVDWAETAPLGRFRLVGRSLYRLGSTPSGIFVDRFDLEVR